MARLSETIKALWAGDVPLPRVFWQYAIVGGFLVNLVGTILVMILATNDVATVWQVLVFSLPIPYNVLMLVAVWRSAGKYRGRPSWANLARSAIVLWTIAAMAL